MTQLLKKVSKDEVVEAGRAVYQPKEALVEKEKLIEKVGSIEQILEGVVKDIQRLYEENLVLKQALQAQNRGEQPKVVEPKAVASFSPTAKK